MYLSCDTNPVIAPLEHQSELMVRLSKHYDSHFNQKEYSHESITASIITVIMSY